MLSLICFILVLSLIVMIHELGHLITAKLFGVYCYEFAIGMGPKLFSKKGKETEYSVRALPLGGFVRMAGEDEGDNDVEVPKERQLTGIVPWKRLIIMLAGITMNIISGILIFSIMYAIMGTYVDYPDPVIASVSTGTPAYTAGFKANDEIVSITYENGVTVHPADFYEVTIYMQTYPGYSEYTVLRDGKKIVIPVTPYYDEEAGRYYLGVTMGEYKVSEVTWANAPYYGLKYSKFMMKEVFMTLGNLIRGKGLNNLSGPVGIYEATDEAISSAADLMEGVMFFLNIWAVLSLNVGIFNLLPIPMMDGGRAIMCGIEIVTGKPFNKKLETALMMGSMLLLGLLFAFVMFNDISRIFF